VRDWGPQFRPWEARPGLARRISDSGQAPNKDHKDHDSDRDDLLAEAHRRISDNHGKYVGHVWGEREAGGASVLPISNVDLAFLTEGRSLGAEPLPEATATAMDAVPFAFTGVLAAMAGLSWIIDRRMARQRDKSDE
jgi:formate dehydrogenase iron-sulfur subunit